MSSLRLPTRSQIVFPNDDNTSHFEYLQALSVRCRVVFCNPDLYLSLLRRICFALCGLLMNPNTDKTLIKKPVVPEREFEVALLRKRIPRPPCDEPKFQAQQSEH